MLALFGDYGQRTDKWRLPISYVGYAEAIEHSSPDRSIGGVEMQLGLVIEVTARNHLALIHEL